MSARVRLEVARAENVLSAHEAALRFAPEGAEPAEPRSRVWVRTGPQDVEAVAVKTGVSDGVHTALEPVEEGSLEEGSQLAVGLFHPDNGAKKPAIQLGKKK
jgi:hypothetical protein